MSDGALSSASSVEHALEVCDVIEVPHLHAVEERLDLPSGKLRIGKERDIQLWSENRGSAFDRHQRRAVHVDAVDLDMVWTPLRPVAEEERPAGMPASRPKDGVSLRAGHLVNRPLDDWPFGEHLVPVERSDVREIDVDGEPRCVEHEQVYRGPAV